MARKAGSHGEITGPAIREAAMRLFARSGYAAVSMREIAADVGVGAGALYLYTPDKQTLLFDLMESHLDALIVDWLTACPDADADHQLRAFVEFHLSYHLDRRDAVYLAYMELRSLTPENHARIEAKRRAYEAELETILTDGHASGLFRVPDARITTMALIALLTGPHVWYRDDGRLTRQDIQTMYWDLTKRMVTA